MSRPVRISAFFAELKRRHVPRVAVSYAAVAFATVSVASDFLPALRLPEWTVTLVAALVLLGFPVAMVLAWAYDITPEGVRRAAPAEVAPEVDAEPGAGAEGPVPSSPQGLIARSARGRSRRARLPLYLGAAALVLLVSGGAAWRAGLLPRSASLPSIAVLPFVSLSADPADDYFSAGMHEDVMTQLYKLGGMDIISRTSVMQYRGTSKSLRAVGQELGVGAILEASVRRSGSRVRIDARLIDAETDRQLWAESYDREMRDVLAIQAEIAQQIAEALHTRLSPIALKQLAATRERSVDPEMYELYLRGLYESGEGRHTAAIAALRRAVDLDPTYAPAHAGIARSYYSLGFFGELPPAEAFRSMRDAASRALELDPDLADAHGTLALYYLHQEWDWERADRHFQRALQLSPNHAQVRHDYAHYLLAVGRTDRSFSESARAARLDPGNMMLKACVGWHSFTDREYHAAVTEATGALMMMADAYWPEIILGWAYEHQGRHGEAIAALRNAVAHSQGSPFAVASLAHALAQAGERTPARALLTQLLEESKKRYVSAYDLAVVHAGIGDAEGALAWLDRAFQERSAMLVNVGWDPRFDALRADPRFAALVGRMRLPERPEPRRRDPPVSKSTHRGM